MRYLPGVLAFSTGFISLSLEILWVRLTSFAYRGAPQSFGLVLGLYLIGIALGAEVGKRFCRRDINLLRLSGLVLLVAAAIDAVSPWIYAQSLVLERRNALFVLAPCIVLVAALKSVIFPIAHHLGSLGAGARLGRSVSRVYFLNILGATIGPMVTGFGLLQVLSMQQCFMLMAGLTLAVSVACFLAATPVRAFAAMAATTAAAIMVAVVVPDGFVRRIAQRTQEASGTIGTVIENRYGIIHTLQVDGQPDTIYGGNAYDGMVNVRLVPDPNWVDRVYLLAALHDAPRRTLEIGMSVGAWTQIIAGIPGTATIDVVEINPAYAALAGQYAATKSLLSNRKIAIHVDDGRRWLKRHPDSRYDLIVMNTTFHWRAYSTLLLSVDFLREVKQHMLPGAVLAFNSTGSQHVFRTAQAVFPYVYKYRNFVYASDHDLAVGLGQRLPRISEVSVDGHSPAADPPSAVAAVMSEIAREFKTFDQYEREARPGFKTEVITDQNMITEYRYGETPRGFLRWPK